MSRLKNFTRNLATSYLQLGVNIVYSLVSVPLILHYLPKAEFGLWALLLQMMGYISLIDLGMTSAVARLLVDHKDNRSEKGYASLVKTAFLASLVQGGVILAAVTLSAPLLASMMKIPVEYQHTFVVLMRWQGTIAAFSFCLRPLNLMLYAHQRMDIPTYNDMFNLLGSLGMLLVFLTRGCGIFSFVYASTAMALVGPCYLFWNCRRLGFLPQPGEWGKASWTVFKEVFGYGKNVFLMNLGAQLVTASQVIIVSRALGLEAAAAWAVGTKIFNLCMPLMCRPYGAALPGLFEMLARGETDRLRSRFKGMVILTGSLGVFLGVSLGLCNSLFVSVWTNHRISWSPENDLLLGLWLFVSSLQTTHLNFVAVTKQFGGARYIYFLEGCCFVLLASLAGRQAGFSGILAASTVCTVMFSYQYGIRLSGRYFKCAWREIAFEWVRPCLKFAAFFVPFAVMVWFSTAHLPALWRLAVHAVAAGVIGGFLFLRIGFPAEIIQELRKGLPQPLAKVLGILIPDANPVFLSA
jgi:O-antigen/teichoic acid export membrane protein